jgi:hypothetical protein
MAQEDTMKWATKELIHFDRVASAWLILRFVDSDAQFIFLKNDQQAEAGVELFGVPGAKLAAHDGQITTFQRICNAYNITDVGVVQMSSIIADTVSHVMNDAARSDLAKREPYVGGILAITEGALLLSASDEECLERCLPVYDAFLARLQAQIAVDQGDPAPPTVLSQTVLLSNAAREMRNRQACFSPTLFTGLLKVARPL